MPELQKTWRSTLPSRKSLATAVRGISLDHQTVPLLFVWAMALLLAVRIHGDFAPEHRQLWTSYEHDRNANIYQAMMLANDVEQFNIVGMVKDFDRLRVWPAWTSTVAVAASMVVGSHDARSAVIPSLIGWIDTVVFSFLIVRRCVPKWGNFAGMAVAVVVAASPALRAYATDVMQESLGLCLTLAAIYGYLLVKQQASRHSGIFLGVALTLLFMHKYNYWLLALIALLAAEAVSSPREWLQIGTRTIRNVSWREAVFAHLRQPTTWVLILLVAAFGVIRLYRGESIRIFSAEIKLRSTMTVVTITYALFLGHVCWMHGRSIRRWLYEQPAHQRMLAFAHGIPLLVWFLWPQRLTFFCWFLSPTTNQGEREHPLGLLSSIEMYTSGAISEYHVGTWSAILMAALATVACVAAVVSRRMLRPGGLAPIALLLFSATLTAMHTNQKIRFLHSWLPALWLTAGIGGAVLADWALRWKGRQAGWVVATICLGGMFLHIPSLAARPHSSEGGVQREHATNLEMTDAYLSELNGSQPIALWSNGPAKFLQMWTYAQRFPHAPRMESEINGMVLAGSPSNFACLDQWAQTTRCEMIVYLHIDPNSPHYREIPGHDGCAQYGEWLRKQHVFTLHQTIAIGDSTFTATIWKKK